MTGCEVADCERDARSWVKDWHVCTMHWKRWRRHASFEVTRKWSPPNLDRQACTVDDCDQLQDGASAYCKKHDTRFRRHGDPLAHTHQRDRNLPRREDHHAWTGDDATYAGAHQRVAKRYGQAKNYPCEDCGSAAAQWSYNRKSTQEKSAPEGPYSPNPADYVARCVPCHKQFDLAHIRGDYDRA